MTTQEKKQAYLKCQEEIAAKFAMKGGECAKLAAERITEAQRVIRLPDAEFEDYVAGWIRD